MYNTLFLSLKLVSLDPDSFLLHFQFSYSSRTVWKRYSLIQYAQNLTQLLICCPVTSSCSSLVTGCRISSTRSNFYEKQVVSGIFKPLNTATFTSMIFKQPVKYLHIYTKIVCTNCGGIKMLFADIFWCFANLCLHRFLVLKGLKIEYINKFHNDNLL